MNSTRCCWPAAQNSPKLPVPGVTGRCSFFHGVLPQQNKINARGNVHDKLHARENTSCDWWR